jgi:hypothetical protein
MSGNKGVPDTLDHRERWSDPTEASQAAHDGRQAAIHTSMPGIIVSYNPATLTARVKPAIQGNLRSPEGKISQVNLAELPDVPVHFPGGGGAILTFPVKPGDDCLLVFSERSIDYWHQLGGQQKQQDWRMHDINDAICMVGVRSMPAVPGSVSGTTTQLRTDDGSVVLELDQGGTIRLVAPSTVIITTPLVKVSGDVIAGTISLRNHRHKDTQPGGGESGVPKP